MVGATAASAAALAEGDQPSMVRCNQLLEFNTRESNIPTVSSFFLLEQYYDASDNVLELFEAAYAKKALEKAYIYRMQYCTLYVHGFVTHDYY
jgi:hypothetical protein